VARHLSRSADVYAYGVLLWELWCSAGAWSGMSQAQVIAAILVRNRRLEFLADTPEDYKVRTAFVRALRMAMKLVMPSCNRSTVFSHHGPSA